jgi:hypothetical protein
LPNLLMAEIRAANGEVAEAKRMLHYALSLLAQAGLRESTYTVQAMNTLCGVQLAASSYDEALRTSSKMIDVLTTLGYTSMPIFADALGTAATVHMHMRQPLQAQRLFCAALEVTQSWLADKDAWIHGSPYQHCLDLDVWLLEGHAEAYREQGMVTHANELMVQAAERRSARGLALTSLLTSTGEFDVDNIDQHDVLGRPGGIGGACFSSSDVDDLFSFPAVLDISLQIPQHQPVQPYPRHIY